MLLQPCMSGAKPEEVKVQELGDDDIPNLQHHKVDVEDVKDSENHEENPVPSSEQEEEIIKKKYGGMLPKKPPLISKDHERAFFDSADWALGKQKGQKPKGPLEALRPKLQPTAHQQSRSRRSAYAPADDSEGAAAHNGTPGDADCEMEHDNNNDSPAFADEQSSEDVAK